MGKFERIGIISLQKPGDWEMRRKDREITEIDEILDIIKKCTVCRLAFFDFEFPYIIPLNFGLEYENGEITLYFHCANQGKKLDRIKENNKVGFEMDTDHKLIEGELACDYTMEYGSVVGNGRIEALGEKEKIHALTVLMNHYSPKDSFSFDENMVKAVSVLKLSVNAVSGKSLKR